MVSIRLLSGAFLMTALLLLSNVKAQVNKASLLRGKKVYETICIACHQADAMGVPRMNPPLIKTPWVLGDKKRLIQIVLKGLPGGTIEIDGDVFNNPMPPQETLLNDQQVADVLTYVRISFGNKASAVTAAEVKSTRSKK
jgi:mono/diheme cytochrome c family protein